MTHGQSIVYVAPDKLGGVVTLLEDLLTFRPPSAFTHHVVLTDNALSDDTRFAGRLPADSQQTFHYRQPVENLHSVLRRLASALPSGGGVLVTSDLLELALASAIDLDRTVVMILHGNGEFYYRLAERHQDAIDAFVCAGPTMRRNLLQRLPEREGSVFHLPYGVPLAPRRRSAHGGPLRLLYVGRLAHEPKGVFDLPEIDRGLREAGVAARWTIVGAGPDEAALRARWAGAAHVRWLGAQPRATVYELAADHDVFVLPTRSEGFPLTLLEIMSAGVVPVVSNLTSGVSEAVDDRVHGLMPAVGDVRGFVGAIRALSLDRARLEAMSAAAAARVAGEFDVRANVRAYHELFASHLALRRPRPRIPQYPYATRLDRPWLPNSVVKAVRTTIRLAQGRPC